MPLSASPNSFVSVLWILVVRVHFCRLVCTCSRSRGVTASPFAFRAVIFAPSDVSATDTTEVLNEPIAAKV